MTWPPLPQGLDPSMHYICTFIPAITPTLSTVTLVKALDNVAVRIEQMVTPIIIQPTAKSRAATDFGVLSPYLRKIMHLKFLMKKFKMALLPFRHFYICDWSHKKLTGEKRFIIVNFFFGDTRGRSLAWFIASEPRRALGEAR